MPWQSNLQVVANVCMENIGQEAISLATKKTILWYRYVDDMFVMWSHRKDKLQEFLEHLNDIHVNTKFCYEDGTKHFNFTILGHPAEQETGWVTWTCNI